MKKQMNYILTGATAISVLLSSCKKEFDAPPVNEIPVGKKIQSINTLLKMFVPGSVYEFTEDYSVYGVVTIDEQNGNLYKNVFIQDNPSDVTNPDSLRGINVRLLNSGGIYQGDYIRINLKGCDLSVYNGVYQIDSVDVDKNIVKQKTQVNIEPALVTIDELKNNIQKFSGRLIKINNVEFASNDLGTTYADAVGQKTKNKALMDCSGNKIDVRTSGYANFAGTTISPKNGSITGILSVFGSGTSISLQMYLRTPNEVAFNKAERCDGTVYVEPILYKGFEDQSVTSGGWTNINVSGDVNWTTNSQGSGQEGSYYAQATNYIGAVNFACETWLISPALDLSAANNPLLSFMNAKKDYGGGGPLLEVRILTNYSSGNPNNATSTPISATLSSGNFSWVTSDNHSLPKQANVRIAFKFTGNTGTSNTVWELDKIRVID